MPIILEIYTCPKIILLSLNNRSTPINIRYQISPSTNEVKVENEEEGVSNYGDGYNSRQHCDLLELSELQTSKNHSAAKELNAKVIEENISIVIVEMLFVNANELDTGVKFTTHEEVQ
uniref:Uncharacterized protein n=1 Tax=Tanacetum cinerariifolium TaxID=118510 RepID=A0A6L2MCG4_TANCI|nr:hypothetical protein [Tanacetum cinerariifolium]